MTGIFIGNFQSSDEKVAIQIAEKRYQECEYDDKTKPSKMYSTSTVFRLIRDIKNKVDSIN